MKTTNFSTTLKCSGCIATVTPNLNALDGVTHWEVNLGHPDKILTVICQDQLEDQQIIDALQQKGYQAEVIGKTY